MCGPMRSLSCCTAASARRPVGRAQITVEEFKDYLSGLYVERKTSPRPDMMSWLMEAQAADPAVRKEESSIRACSCSWPGTRRRRT